MHTDPIIRITLEIKPSSEPIAGWAEAETGERRPFVGMLELIGMLESARAGAGEGSRA